MSIPDTTYVAQAQAGDETAFSELLRRYQRPILNFAYRLLGDAADAADVAQDTFVRAHCHIREYDVRRPFSTWLFAIARNACWDRLRTRRRRGEVALEAVPEPATINRAPELNETARLISAAVAALPVDQRTALVLAEYHDLGYAEIAAIMHCSTKSVESRLYRAKQTLRERLAFLRS